MTRSPLFLAALASSAVPGLDPVRVQGVATRPGDLFEIAYVHDSQDRRWVVKAPCTAAAGAMLDDVSALSGLLGRRIEVAIPMVRGYSPVPEGRAAVYLRLPGRPLDFAALDAGPLAVEVGRALGHIHNIEHLVFEEAGRPTYDAEAHRRRQLSELDRAAATGHVPTGLLTRWEHALEDVSLWRFAPSAVHGTFTGDNLLASFEDDDDASTGRVRGVLAWEESRISDPADDFAELASVAPAATLDAVLDAYSETRIERPDVHLLRRARLAAEMAPLRRLLRALSAGQLEVVESTAEELRALEGRVEAHDRRHAREDARRGARAPQSDRPDDAEASGPASQRQPDQPQQPQPPGPAQPQQDQPQQQERPEPDWDATQPHVPFPMSGQTQAISMAPLLDEPGDGATGNPSAYAVPSSQPSPQTGESRETPGVREAPDSHADQPVPHPEESQPVPVVAPDAEASPFEIDEVEALPEDAAAVLDLHEGASGFVPVNRPGHSHSNEQG